MNNREYIDMITKNPEDWVFGKYWAENTKLSIRYWISNGILFFNTQGVSPLNFYWRRVLWYRLKEVIKKQHYLKQ